MYIHFINSFKLSKVNEQIRILNNFSLNSNFALYPSDTYLLPYSGYELEYSSFAIKNSSKKILKAYKFNWNYNQKDLKIFCFIIKSFLV